MDPYRVTRGGGYAFTWLDITGSTISGPHSAVLVGGTTPVASLDDDETETVQDTASYGAPAIVFRPRPPESVTTPGGSRTVGAEAIGARTGDDAVPVAWRDLRWNRAFPAPKAGTAAFVGYGGGFLSMDDSATDCGDQKASVQTLYCPYDYLNGLPRKAHCIILDPVEESVTIIQGDGTAVLLTDEGVTLRSPNGAARLTVTNDGIQLVGNIIHTGAAILGINPGIPLPPVSFPVAYMSGGAPLVSTSVHVAS